MNVLVCLEHHFITTPDQEIWTPTSFDYAFWTRYLEVFDSVHVLARVAKARETQEGWKRADGEQVSFRRLPDYRGPWQFLKKASEVRTAVRRSVKAYDAVILRAPGQVANCVESVLRSRNQPFALEVVADPWDVFAAGASSSFVRPVFRWWFRERLKRQCRTAVAAAYVTENSLQKRYPPNYRGYSTYYSDVFLSNSDFVDGPRDFAGTKSAHIVSIGSLDQLYKAPDVVLKALAICMRQGLDFTFTWIGGGRYQTVLESMAKSLGLSYRVRFLGEIPSGEPVRRSLDKADLFVMASLTEGLPRAMIEAMARGLPCIGTAVGGIPELLGRGSLVEPGDPVSLAKKMTEFITDPLRMRRESRSNLEKSKQYRESELRRRRRLLYEKIRDKQAEWLGPEAIQEIENTRSGAGISR